MNSISEQAAKTELTLFTNLQFATIEGPPSFRFWTNALLIEEGSPGFIGPPSDRLRAFGPDAAWPVFDYVLEPGDLPFSIEQGVADQSMVMIGEEGIAKPIFSGAILKFGKMRMFLQSSKADLPIDIHHQVGDISGLWNILAEKATKYWDMPNMPVLAYVPPSRASAMRRRFGHSA